MIQIFRNIAAAILLAFPSFQRRGDTVAEVKKIVRETPSLPGGQLEKVDKHYGKTVAGGPGSQKIGDAFDALPKEVREQWIAARKGRIISVPTDALDDQRESSVKSVDRLSRGVNAASRRSYTHGTNR